MSAPTDDEAAFVDEVAEFFAREGLPLISGRVVGWLLICDPPQQSPAQIAEALHVSRSSLSTAARLLTPSGLVETVRRPGDRNAYLRISADGWSRMLERRYAQASGFREVTEHGLRVLRDASAQRRERLANVNELYRFLESELPALFQRWQRTRGKDPAP
ncbi:GbsR/MarR family transcriptional regulator [Nocardiopsis changdeensis]|uniref:MarR family transcriptional regulator n=1 Tax=Nocardiopsis changdeensis TaxID=2831969 RepID=A0ABX8BU57_9ACTN|nr:MULTISPECIES: MarR family transcriptional regulator [Nocardiopsis]QUX25614.1 MarR family transcriptional regulator [Nocardiopsis changdeensis]QYX36001.1 MarR family transcriptional regulator [Nocardiopsis sp. MT53]